MCENRFYVDTYYTNISYYRDWIVNLKQYEKIFVFIASIEEDFDEYNSDLANAVWHYINLVGEDNTYLAMNNLYTQPQTDKYFYYYL